MLGTEATEGTELLSFRLRKTDPVFFLRERNMLISKGVSVRECESRSVIPVLPPPPLGPAYIADMCCRGLDGGVWLLLGAYTGDGTQNRSRGVGKKTCGY